MHAPSDSQPATRDLDGLAARILSLASVEEDLDALLARIVLEVKQATAFEAVGLRLKDGEDFPYYFTEGLDDDFVQQEMFLCARDPLGELVRDSEGNPYLECMCGNIIAGRTDAKFPFFTAGGSFVSNGTSALLATTSEADRQARTRNRCNSEGYESVGLFPLKLGHVIHGLLQLNDRRIGRFDDTLVMLMEAVAVCIAMVFQLRQVRRDAAVGVHDVQVGLTARAGILDRIARELEARNQKDHAVPPALLATLGELLDDLSRASGVLPICATCKRIRDAGQEWHPVDEFIADRSRLHLSHTFCPACYAKAMREFEDGAA